jgi:hypothetical protein
MDPKLDLVKEIGGHRFVNRCKVAEIVQKCILQDVRLLNEVMNITYRNISD